MNLFEYIKSQLPHLPNPAIMKNMGASEELIGYIKESPWNTNLGMLAIYGCEPSGEGTEPVDEVWATITSATGRITLQSDGTKEESGATTNKQYADWLNMFNNPSNYEVKANMNCGEGSMEYIGGNLQRFLYEDKGYTVAIVLSQGTIVVSADQKDDCVPIEIIVTKK